MTDEQLEAVVARTGVDRYRWLTSEANPDARSRQAYRVLVERRSGEGSRRRDAASLRPRPPSRRNELPAVAEAAKPPLEAALRARNLGGLNCPHGSPPACGCSGLAACSLLGRDVNIRDCTACLTTGPRSREV